MPACFGVEYAAVRMRILQNREVFAGSHDGINTKREGPYNRIYHFLTRFEMDLIHTEYPYILG